MIRILASIEDGAQKVFGAVLVVIFISMVVVGGLQVFNRFLINVSLSWSEEFQRYGQAWLVFISIPYAYSRAYHIGMNFLTGRFSPGIRAGLAFAVDVVWAGLGILLIVTGYRIVSLGMTQISAGLGVSMAFVYSVIILSGLYTTVLALRRLLERMGGNAEPAAS